MKLTEGEIGHIYCIKNMHVEERIMRRLEALGINEGAFIKVLNKKKGALIVKVRSTRFAVGQVITDGITVEEAGGSHE